MGPNIMPRRSVRNRFLFPIVLLVFLVWTAPRNLHYAQLGTITTTPSINSPNPWLLLLSSASSSSSSSFDEAASSADADEPISPATSHAAPAAVRAEWRKSRILLGIFTTESSMEGMCRRQFRNIFQLDTVRICSLSTVLENGHVPVDCQVIYTFVVGGIADDKNRTTPSLRSSEPFLVPENKTRQDADRVKNKTRQGADRVDMTLLNIRENMNEGKSATWFAYAASIMEKYDIDYVAKSDSDTMLYMDRMFAFLNRNLPPSPYNTHILAGLPLDKHWWSKTNNGVGELESRQARPKERWFANKFGRPLHLYTAGQFYVMSTDLAKAVAAQAAKQEKSSQQLAYLEGHEDHDVSTMAFHGSEQAIHFILMGMDDLFWRHPVKMKRMGRINFEKAWNEERARLEDALRIAPAVARHEMAQ